MSAARLAAEALFARPSVSPDQLPAAQVIVRRARVLTLVGQAPGQGTTDTPPAPPDKAPRVFRVEPTSTAATAAVPMQAIGVVPGESTSALGPAVSRRRRVARDKRPGPVVHLVQAVALPAPAAAPTADSLTQALARMDPLLASIAELQSRQFSVLERSDAWQQLSRRVEALRAELPTQRRWIDAQVDAQIDKQSR